MGRNADWVVVWEGAKSPVRSSGRGTVLQSDYQRDSSHYFYLGYARLVEFGDTTLSI